MEAASVAELIGATLRLSNSHYLNLSAIELRVVIAVVFLAGLSAALGQSLVLFVNRVKPKRFLASLLLSAGTFVVGLLFWGFSIWLIGRYGYSREVPYSLVLRAVGLAFSPYLFSFFVLTPYFGSFLWVALSIWSLLAMVLATSVVLELTLWQALLSNAGGWLLLQVLARTIGRPVMWLSETVRSWVAGTSLVRLSHKTRPSEEH